VNLKFVIVRECRQHPARLGFHEELTFSIVDAVRRLGRGRRARAGLRRCAGLGRCADLRGGARRSIERNDAPPRETRYRGEKREKTLTTTLTLASHGAIVPRIRARR
jgi:hypothetical protein